MTKIAFTIETDPLSVGALLENPHPGIKVIPPKIQGDALRGDMLGFMVNVEITVVIDLSLSTVAAAAAYIVGRLHGSRNAKMHLNQRTITVNDPSLIEAELGKLEHQNQQHNLPKQT